METPSGTVTPVDLEQGDGQIRKRLTVTFRGLNVRVTAPDAALGNTLWSEMDPRQIGGLLKRSNGPKRVGDSSE
jgi:ATP-binding cassette subfamily G (WHITE) protein 2 (SNQ2)